MQGTHELKLSSSNKPIQGLTRYLTGTWLGLFWVVNLVFAGVMGFIPNPLVGEAALFEANTSHNLFHILSAVGLIAAVVLGPRPASYYMLAFGVLYATLGVAGFFVTGHHGGGHLLGVVHINTADNFLHIFLGVLITISGWISSRN